MYKCEYCNRHLKKKYDKCPACGSTSFKKIQNYGEEIIKTPPADGYILNLKNYSVEKNQEKALILALTFIMFVMITPLMIFLFVDLFRENSTFPKIVNILTIIVFLIGIVRIIIGTYKMMPKSKVDFDKLKILSKNGILIKNLKYKIKAAEKEIKGKKTVYRIQIIYEIEKGKTKCFESEPKYLGALGRDDGTADLLVDPNDYSNYFIDFEIY